MQRELNRELDGGVNSFVHFVFSLTIASVLYFCILVIGKKLGWWYKNEVWFSVAPAKSKGNPELQRTSNQSLLWVTTASRPLNAPLKSKMTGLKDPKQDQISKLFNPKTIGTLEELLITP